MGKHEATMHGHDLEIRDLKKGVGDVEKCLRGKVKWAGLLTLIGILATIIGFVLVGYWGEIAGTRASATENKTAIAVQAANYEHISKSLTAQSRAIEGLDTKMDILLKERPPD
jgi:hypothetical protein